jgi:hypothetical protein
MNSESKYSNPESATQQQPEVNPDPPGSLTKVATPSVSQEQLGQIWDQVRLYLDHLPEFLVKFFANNQKPLLTVGLFVLAIVGVKVTLAVLDAIDDIPLLSPVLEIIGLVYTAWFIWRYLLKANTRQELSQEIQSLKDQVLGNTPKK